MKGRNDQQNAENILVERIVSSLTMSSGNMDEAKNKVRRYFQENKDTIKGEDEKPTGPYVAPPLRFAF
jgi:hypothetical protein